MTTPHTQIFDSIISNMQKHGMKLPNEKIYIKIATAREILYEGMKYFIEMEHKELVWLPEYEKVAEWLSDNQGRGLFLHGQCGRGKSILCRYVIPAILLQYTGKVVSVFDVQEMNKNIDYVLTKHIISLDDIGTEEMSVKFGEKRMAFPEIMDMAEKRGNLIIVSTNLNSDKLTELYGSRIMDRIIATTTRISFNGKSLRQ